MKMLPSAGVLSLAFAAGFLAGAAEPPRAQDSGFASLDAGSLNETLHKAGDAVKAGLVRSAGAAGRTEAALVVVDVDKELSVFDPTGGQGTLYLGKKDPDYVVRIFDRVSGVSGIHIRELVRLNAQLRAQGIPVPPVEPVRTTDWRWGVRMPLVPGQSLLGALDALNPESGVRTDPQARALRDQAVWTLDRIDAVTEKAAGLKLASRGGRLLGEEGGLANFIVVADGAGNPRVLDVDPIDLRALRDVIDRRNPEASASLTAAAGSVR